MFSRVPSWEPLPSHTYGCIECIGKKPLSDLLDAQASSIAMLCGRLDTLLDMEEKVFTKTGDYGWNTQAKPWIPGLSVYRGRSHIPLHVAIGTYGLRLSPPSPEHTWEARSLDKDIGAVDRAFYRSATIVDDVSHPVQSAMKKYVFRKSAVGSAGLNFGYGWSSLATPSWLQTD